MTEFIRLESPDETIHIGFTDQKISGRTGLLSFAGFLRWHRFGERLAEVLPASKQRNRGFEPFEFARSFLTGVFCTRTVIGNERLSDIHGLEPSPACTRSSRYW